MSVYMWIEKVSAIASRMIHCMVSPSLRNALVLALNYFCSLKTIRNLKEIMQKLSRNKIFFRKYLEVEITKLYHPVNTQQIISTSTSPTTATRPSPHYWKGRLMRLQQGYKGHLASGYIRLMKLMPLLLLNILLRWKVRLTSQTPIDGMWLYYCAEFAHFMITSRSKTWHVQMCLSF